MELKGTTIVGVKRDGKTVIAGDGQVTAGQSVIMKGNAVKVSEKFEEMLNKYSGNLMRSAVALAQLWRGDRALRQLEAMMIVADSTEMLVLSGVGDVIQPENGVCAIGSGGNYALAAARALIRNTKLSAKSIAVEAMKVASEICVFTNGNLTVEEV